MRTVSQLNYFIDAAQQARHLSPNNYLVLNGRGRPVAANQSFFPSSMEGTPFLARLPLKALASLKMDIVHRVQSLLGVNSSYRVENRRIWEVFLKSLRKVYGSAKIHRLCHRYQVNFQELYAQGKPLLPKYVKMVSIGSHRIFTRDLQRRASKDLSSLRCAEIKKSIAKHLVMRPMGKPLDPLNIYGAPTKLRAWLSHDPVLMDKELLYLCSDVKRISFKQWLERAAKCTVNKEFQEKQILPVPGVKGSVQYYQVYRRIACNGLIAYALTPLGADSTLSPLLLFRPTQLPISSEDALETLMNDFQTHIGEWGYSTTKKEFDRLMKDPRFCPDGQKVMTAGYSLGGTFAQRFIVDHWKKVSQAFLFNSPSLQTALAEKFATKVNAAPSSIGKIELNIFRSSAGDEGDIAHMVGSKHLGWGVNHRRVKVKLTEYHHQSQLIRTLLDRFWLHSRRVLDNDHGLFISSRVSRRALNEHLDNESRGPVIFWYEKTRRIWGNTIYWVLYSLNRLLKSIGVLRSTH